MQRGVIHYDELTECGLFEDAGGQVHVFRKDDAVYREIWTSGKPVLPAAGVVILSDRLPVSPTQFPEKPLSVPSRAGFAGSAASQSNWLTWAGMALSGLALLLLINIGGEPRKGGTGSNPKLIESLWAVAAGALLLVELIYFSIGSARKRIRTNYWGIVVCTVFASLLMKGCENYESDKVADVYTVVLGILMVVVYLLPKRNND